MLSVISLLAFSASFAMQPPSSPLTPREAIGACTVFAARGGIDGTCGGKPAVRTAMVLKHDERNDPASYFLPDRHADLGVVGQVECLEPNGSGRSHNTTGWLAGSADTVITAAHAFFVPPDPQRDGGELRLDPKSCLFVTFNADQSLRDVIPIRYAVSDWSDHKRMHDANHDVAVIKLDRPLALRGALPIRVEANGHGTQVMLIAFQSGVRAQQIPRMTQGQASQLPRSYAYIDPYGRMTRAGTKLFASSADSSAGSSGGVYIDTDDHAAIGIHIGKVCSEGEAAFKDETCLNFGLYFDAHILDQIHDVVSDRPIAAALIRNDPAL
jgi:hypothetical protein